jgi:hypothetical protein
MHWNIGQYGVLTNSISSDMLPKFQVEYLSSGHNNISSISIWANGSLDLYPASRRLGTRTYCILSYIRSILSKPISYTLVNQIMCSVTLHRPLWEHLVNRRAGRRTHLSKGSSTTIWTVVDITPTILCLREMRKSWYEFGFISCMCISMRKCGCLLLDDVDDLSYVLKIRVNVYRQCGWLLLSNMVYVCGLSCIMSMLFVDSHVWMILFMWW